MKNRLKWFVLLLGVVFVCSAFAVACGNGDDKGSGNKTVEATNVSFPEAEMSVEIGKSIPIKATISPSNANAKVTWSVEDETVADVTNQGLGYNIARVTGKKVGTTTLTVSVSGKSATCELIVAEHVPVQFYLRGSSKGKHFDWNTTLHTADTVDATKPTALLAKNETETVHTVTVDLYEGDEFKFDKVLADSDTTNAMAWKNQIGGASDATVAELTLTNKAEETTLPSSEVTSGNPPSFKVGADGKYLIKLDVTSMENTVITYKRVGDAEAMEIEYVWYIRGSGEALNNWAEVTDKTAAAAGSVFATDATTGIHTITVTLAAEDAFKFAVVNQDWSGALGYAAIEDPNGNIETNADGNIVIVTPGEYTFTISADNKKITYTGPEPTTGGESGGEV